MHVERLEFRDSHAGPAGVFKMTTPAGRPFRTECVLVIVFAGLSTAQWRRFYGRAGRASRFVDPKTGVQYICPEGGSNIDVWLSPWEAAKAFKTTEIDAVATAALRRLKVLLDQ
ncbi:MAG TPA: hypothetical protein VFZ48_01360 [Candidatus Saccharimonadales bacterium]